MMTHTIRTATRDDIDALLAMGQRFLESSPYRRWLRGNAQAGRGLTERLIAGPDSVVFVAEVDGVVAGCIGGHVMAHPMAGDRVANEIMWWVNPEARGIGRDLLRELEAWAKAVGSSVLVMVAPTLEVGALYERLGYSEVERHYQKGLL